MNNYTREKLKKSLEKTNHVLTLDDFDDIQELDRIAEEIGGAVSHLESLDDYFMLGGCAFIRPTFRRIDLIQKTVLAYWLPQFKALGVLYALQTELDYEDLSTVPTRRQLLDFGKRIDATNNEITAAIEKYVTAQSETDAEGEDGKPLSGYKLACIIAREIGGTVDEWMDSPPEKLESALKVIDEKIQSEVSAMNKSGGGRAAPSPTPKMYAMKRFMEKLHAMEIKWQA
jgi:hypothetical protein